jgi:hypothetical protein
VHLELDAEPWAECGWEGRELAFAGGVRLRFLHPCERCVIPTIDPGTREKWPRLLRHLAAEHDTLFGINARVIAGGRIALGELRPGAVFGEMGLVDDVTRSATVVALERTECVLLAKWDFEKALREDAQVGLALLRDLSARVRTLESRLPGGSPAAGLDGGAVWPV